MVVNESPRWVQGKMDWEKRDLFDQPVWTYDDEERYIEVVRESGGWNVDVFFKSLSRRVSAAGAYSRPYAFMTLTEAKAWSLEVEG